MRKYFVERFRNMNGQKNYVLDMHYESFDYKCVEDFDDAVVDFSRLETSHQNMEKSTAQREARLDYWRVMIEHLMKT